ncbi:serine hydrolase [Marilutibacter spongiae]|uniref:Beta-lactamase n=1 Tax=Marilutibacter spongiae TaxID=2025720 RepID=A0A7W3Y4R3_9GAMM|nr:serine hydrolase [Lysobacter spongiae]MBB1059728.1 serine hydrolase [Lysobacter spongiae]
MRPRPVLALPLLAAAVLFGSACAAPPPAAAPDAGLQSTLDARLRGDRSGACMAVGVVDMAPEGAPDPSPRVRRAYGCAEGDAARIGPDSAFEIGSISKTMTATLLAGLVLDGKARLDDPLSAYLPEGTPVPDFEGQPILLRHLVTHTSGLPVLPPIPVADAGDPYAAMRPDDLLQALGRVSLAQAPGSKFAYSNYASMLLSYAVARRAGTGLEALLDDRLFTPLGMEGAHVAHRPAGVVEAQGHMPNGQAVPAWHFDDALAGVGGVRATLDDMIRYAEAGLGAAPEPLASAMALTRQPIETASGRPIAMNWMRMQVDGRDVLAHEGGTGGFSSLIALDPARGRGVVVLSDTALTALGGLGGLGLHLVDEARPLPGPRTATPAPAALVDALVGDWQLEGGPALTLRRRGDGLEVQAPGQPAFEMGHDSAGDFYPLAFDALLSPTRTADGHHAFNWHQGGAVMPARRVDASAPTQPASKAPSAGALAEYAGRYPLAPTDMLLTVSVRDGVLQAQASGQGAFELSSAGKDVFTARAFGIEIRFERDAQGRVSGLALHQGGNVLRGGKQ